MEFSLNSIGKDCGENCNCEDCGCCIEAQEVEAVAITITENGGLKPIVTRFLKQPRKIHYCLKQNKEIPDDNLL